VRPSAFQLAVIFACSAFISAKLLLCAIQALLCIIRSVRGIARRATIASLSDGGWQSTLRAGRQANQSLGDERGFHDGFWLGLGSGMESFFGSGGVLDSAARSASMAGQGAEKQVTNVGKDLGAASGDAVLGREPVEVAQRNC